MLEQPVGTSWQPMTSPQGKGSIDQVDLLCICGMPNCKMCTLQLPERGSTSQSCVKTCIRDSFSDRERVNSEPGHLRLSLIEQ